MDEHILAREFASAMLGEPPLGFDPDDVVATAARAQRRRRMTLLAGGGVAAVAVAAVWVPLALSGTSRVDTAEPLSTAQVTDQPLSQRELVERQTQAARHLLTVLPKVVSSPTVTSHQDGFVGLFDTPTQVGGRPSPAQQGFGEAAELTVDGNQSNVELAVTIPADPIPPVPVDQQCAVVRRDADGPGTHVTCTLIRLSDGGTLLVSDVVRADRAGYPTPADGQHEQDRGVADFRPDGTEVDVTSSIAEGADAWHVLLPVATLTALATDPVFRLAGG
jgi:hypothetical protein